MTHVHKCTDFRSKAMMLLLFKHCCSVLPFGVGVLC